MISIIPPSDSTVFRIGQKVLFLIEHIDDNISGTLDPALIVESNNIAIIETTGHKIINEIHYDYCFLRFINFGEFYIKVISSTDSGTYTTTIDGIDVLGVAAKTTLNNTDVGVLCSGYIPETELQRINKGSLFKPIRSNEQNLGNIDIGTSSDLFQKNGAGMKLNIWDAANAPISFNTFLEDITDPSDDSGDYLSPRGVSGEIEEYFRLGDFRGYVKNYNESTLFLNNLVADNASLYRLKLSNNITKENGDSYYLENNEISGSLLLSDIGSGETITTNLGDYYLMVYAIDNTSDRHFFKAIKKLSDQQDGSFTVESPLEELYVPGGFLESDNYFENKGTLTRYYFIASSVINISDWVELTKTHNNLLPIEYAPNTVQRKYNYLLELFRTVLPVPVTGDKDYKFENEVILYTEIKATFTNAYSIKRKINLEITGDLVNSFNYFKEFGGFETSDITLENIISDGSSNLEFKNIYRYDTIHWQVGNPVAYEEGYRPTLVSPRNLNINIKDTLVLVDDIDGNNEKITISIAKENFKFNFFNSVASNFPIRVELLSTTSWSPSSIAPGSSDYLRYKNGSSCNFLNLSQYQFRIYDSNNMEMGSLYSLAVSSNNDGRFTLLESHNNEDTYITLTVFLNVGDGEYNDSINPLNIYISMVFFG